MPLKMIPARPEMATLLATIHLEAFQSSPASMAMMPRRTPDVALAWGSLEKVRIQNVTERDYWFVVVDTDRPSSDPKIVPEGEVVAFNKWRHEKAGMTEEHVVDTLTIPGANTEARSIFFAMIDRTRERLMGGKDYFHLLYLATSPKHAGRGAGSMCLNWGARKADELGLVSYLDATPQGRPQYVKFGFRVLDEEDWDLRPFGVDVTYTTCAMLRDRGI